eukprot:8706562-Alexandrium_andersonii.AAC.1
MSASLVGSEMCIRDSPLPLRACTHVLVRACARARERACAHVRVCTHVGAATHGATALVLRAVPRRSCLA